MRRVVLITCDWRTINGFHHVWWTNNQWFSSLVVDEQSVVFITCNGRTNSGSHHMWRTTNNTIQLSNLQTSRRQWYRYVLSNNRITRKHVTIAQPGLHTGIFVYCNGIFIFLCEKLTVVALQKPNRGLTMDGLTKDLGRKYNTDKNECCYSRRVPQRVI